jgi:hypothetical protein
MTNKRKFVKKDVRRVLSSSVGHKLLYEIYPLSPWKNKILQKLECNSCINIETPVMLIWKLDNTKLCLLTTTILPSFVWKKWCLNKWLSLAIYIYSLQNCFSAKLLCYFISLQNFQGNFFDTIFPYTWQKTQWKTKFLNKCLNENHNLLSTFIKFWRKNVKKLKCGGRGAGRGVVSLIFINFFKC